MALLVVNSKALKCIVKGDLSALPQKFQAMMQDKLGTSNHKEECDGMCFYFYISESGSEKFAAAGCQDYQAKLEGIQAILSATHSSVQQKPVDVGLALCSEDKCNTADIIGGKLTKIMNVLKTEVAVLNKPRSTNLVCSGSTGSCRGICEIAYDPNAKLTTDCDREHGSNIVEYQATVGARIAKGDNAVIAAVSCATDNCNARGGEANTVLDKIKEKVKAEVNSSGNISHGFVLAIFLSMIFSIVDL